MEQGTKGWHEWRSKGIGASEAPAIMGESPYTTRLELWELKRGLRKPQETNWAMARGNELEPKARANFELSNDIDMPPGLFEHEKYPFIRASMDGFNVEQRVGLEIKCCGKKNFEIVKSGKIPTDYRAQIMQQFIVTNAETIYLYAFDGENGVSLPVKPDHEYCQRLLGELIKFWDLVQTGIPPEPSEKDFPIIRDDRLEQLCKEYKIALAALNEAEAAVATIREQIKSGLQVPMGVCNGVKFYKVTRRGSVDYASIPELKSVDLEKYRKKPVESFTIKLLTEKVD